MDGDKNNVATVEQWFALYSSELKRFVTRQLGQPSESEDLVQEVFVIALRKLSSYQEKGNARAYLYRIAKNMVLAARRNRQKSIAFESYEDRHARCEPETQPKLNSIYELKSMLQRLESSERTIVQLRIDKGMKFKEIAVALELPLNTVISKFHRALGKLRKR